VFVEDSLQHVDGRVLHLPEDVQTAAVQVPHQPQAGQHQGHGAYVCAACVCMCVYNVCSAGSHMSVGQSSPEFEQTEATSVMTW